MGKADTVSETAIAVPERVKSEQRRASRPDGSAWVRANAGAGKTYVLAQRVLRLLLGGTDPARILCITYTKAAAAEMANRVFEWLGQWATMPDDRLAEKLHELQGRPATDAERVRARRLFAAAIETPGRLRVQTIHAFCERLLQQFPFEASVTAGFSVLDERASSELLAEARAGILRAAGSENGLLAECLGRLAAEVGDETLASLIDSVVRRKDDLKSWIGRDDDLEGALDSLAVALGLDPGEDEAGVTGEILGGDVLPRPEWESVAATLATGSAADRTASGKLLAAIEESESGHAETYLSLFLKADGEPRTRIVTNRLRETHPGLADLLDREQQRIVALWDRLKAARILQSNVALVRFADAVIGRYQHLKGARGLLDYDDLIGRAAALLNRADAGWVLYKLDGGLDHVLVDEAQDTSPRQWQVVGAIVEEFFAGRSARDVTRTLFAVGDEKQSIYSFQGAAPRRFAEMRKRFGKSIASSGQDFGDVELKLSFRSTPAVLSAVDRTFAAPPALIGLAADSGKEPVQHDAIRRHDFGRVEVWPVIEADPREEPAPWDAPFDIERATSPPARLAERIAGTIRRWLDEGERLEATGRLVTAGDIMILVRNRKPFADPMIRALKAAGIPVAGADRLVLTEHIAVMDLMALARFCLLPEDDLNLAALLKSPLIGMSEDELMTVAIGRAGGLWDSLRARPECAAATERLTGWRGRAGFERPYEFFARILGAERMREAFHRRLGAEAFEALDEFLSLALAYERIETPTLAGFLHWLDAAPSEVKRDMDKGRDEVRVMTVHGAKGLEAPIVFLPDTMRGVDARRAGSIFRIGEEEGQPLVWAPRRTDDCTVTRNLREAAVARQIEEEHRLLYVAMTRACDRLYVAGFQTSVSRPEGCWYDLVAHALEPVLTEAAGVHGEPVFRYESGVPAAAVDAVTRTTEVDDGLPEWIDRDVPPEPLARGMAPSHLVEHEPAPAAAGSDDIVSRRAALRRGSIIHRLLEVLPDVEPGRRDKVARHMIRALAPADWDQTAQEALLSEVVNVLDDPAFAEAFRPEGMAELSIAGMLPGIEGPVVGQIDRLAVGESSILIVDYKTDRVVPEGPGSVSAAYIAQLAAYRALVEKLYSDREIRTAILWTAGPSLMEIPASMLTMHGSPASA
jgi:ATP-dependent helicase/nuclease subunit A